MPCVSMCIGFVNVYNVILKLHVFLFRHGFPDISESKNMKIRTILKL